MPLLLGATDCTFSTSGTGKGGSLHIPYRSSPQLPWQASSQDEASAGLFSSHLQLLLESGNPKQSVDLSETKGHTI